MEYVYWRNNEWFNQNGYKQINTRRKSSVYTIAIFKKVKTEKIRLL